MIRCGELCGSCNRHCTDLITEESAAAIECIACNGSGEGANRTKCDQCEGTGVFEINDCPRKYVGRALTDEINLASWAQKGHLPELGGMLDQPAWFVDMWGCLDQDQNQIEADMRKRK